MDILQHIEVKIKEHLQGANVQALDPRRDGKHLKVIVTFAGFKDKSLVDQHRMIYAALEEEMKTKIHALQIETKVE